VVDAEDIPEHDVGIFDVAVLLCPQREACVLLALIDELAARPTLVRMVRSDPEGVAYDLCPA